MCGQHVLLGEALSETQQELASLLFNLDLIKRKQTRLLKITLHSQLFTFAFMLCFLKYLKVIIFLYFIVFVFFCLRAVYFACKLCSCSLPSLTVLLHKFFAASIAFCYLLLTWVEVGVGMLDLPAGKGTAGCTACGRGRGGERPACSDACASSAASPSP